MSKLDFRAKFDPKCPLCPEISETWDDRCRHILAHYEDAEIHNRALPIAIHPNDAIEGASSHNTSEESENAGSNNSSDDEAEG